MSVVYLDTSALGRILLAEPGAREVLARLAEFEQRVASRLLRIELRRLGLRTGRLAAADQLLAGVALIPVDDELLTTAELVAPDTVATLDALHLATALRLDEHGSLDAVMTFDRRLADGARHHGLTVIGPAP